MEEKKYKLTEESIGFNGRTLHRIEAIRDFDTIKKGDKGGFIESETNLSQVGNSWVYYNAKVCDHACVSGNSQVCGEAKVWGFAKISGDAQVFGYASVCGDACVSGNSKVCGHANVYENASIYGDAFVSGNSNVCGHVNVYENASIYGDAKVFGYASVCGDACVSGKCNVYDNAIVCGDADVCGYALICGDACIKGDRDYIVFKNWWSSGRYFTWTRSNNMWKVGCFYGTSKKLIEKAYADSENVGQEYERVVKYVESILGN